MTQQEKIKKAIGSLIQVQTSSGLVWGTIQDIDMEGKNGIPTIDYVDGNGEGFWCYHTQVVKWVD